MILGSAETPATVHGVRGLRKDAGCTLAQAPPALCRCPASSQAPHRPPERAVEVLWEPTSPQRPGCGLLTGFNKGALEETQQG